jgi:hypothetical protein
MRIKAEEEEAAPTQNTQMSVDEGAGADDEPQPSPSKNDKISLVIRSQEGPSTLSLPLTTPVQSTDCGAAFQAKVARTKPLKAVFDKAHVSSASGAYD